MKSPLMLFLGYGVVGGCGLGLGYVTPVATVAKWFPDKKGFATGLVVMGFGLGALVMSKVFAPMLFNYFKTGVELVYANVDGALVLQNPEALQGISPSCSQARVIFHPPYRSAGSEEPARRLCRPAGRCCGG